MKSFTAFIAIFIFACTGAVLSQSRIDANSLTGQGGSFYHQNNLFTGTVYTILDDGQEKDLGYVKNGKPDGIWNAYYSGGEIHNTTTMNNGVLEGMYKSFHLNGQLASIGHFENGNREGVWETYHENGQLESRGSYRRYKVDLWEKYHENGQLAGRSFFIDGEKREAWDLYDENGEKIPWQGLTEEEWSWKYRREIEYEVPVEAYVPSIIAGGEELRHHVRTLLWKAQDDFNDLRGEATGNYRGDILSTYPIGSTSSYIYSSESEFLGHSTRGVYLEGTEYPDRAWTAFMEAEETIKRMEKEIDPIIPESWNKELKGYSDLKWAECEGSRGYQVIVKVLDDKVAMTIGKYPNPCPGPLRLPPLPGDDQPVNSATVLLDWERPPTYGERSLNAGFLPDPFTVEMKAGGEVDVEGMGMDSQCVGYAAEAPDFRLHWSGDSDLLSIAFASSDKNEDTTLIVNAPDESWHCNDDGTGNIYDPHVILSNPQEGQYDIWVGTYDEGSFVAGELLISEREE